MAYLLTIDINLRFPLEGFGSLDSKFLVGSLKPYNRPECVWVFPEYLHIVTKVQNLDTGILFLHHLALEW